jgi:hypothetical protein
MMLVFTPQMWYNFRMSIYETFPPQDFFDACDKWSQKEILVDDKGRQLRMRKDGTVDFSDISHNILGQQDQYPSYYAQGGITGYPHIGRGLRITDGRGNPGERAEAYELGMDRQDVPTFVGRIVAYQALRQGKVPEDGGNGYRYATDEELLQAVDYLKDQGFGELFDAR